MARLRILPFLNLKLVKKAMSMRDTQTSDLMPKYEPSVEEMKMVFDKISNGKDKIELDDLKRLLQQFDVCSARDRANLAKEMMWAVDLNKDGEIDFDDFLEVNRKPGVSVREIKDAFTSFDQDQDGRISAREIKRMMDRLGEKCTLEDCRLMVKKEDTNGDGLIDMNEFMEMMTRNMKPISN